jgi:hypothetical protein
MIERPELMGNVLFGCRSRRLPIMRMCEYPDRERCHHLISWCGKPRLHHASKRNGPSYAITNTSRIQGELYAKGCRYATREDLFVRTQWNRVRGTQNNNVGLELLSSYLRDYIFSSSYLIRRGEPLFENADPGSFASMPGALLQESLISCPRERNHLACGGLGS